MIRGSIKDASKRMTFVTRGIPVSGLSFYRPDRVRTDQFHPRREGDRYLTRVLCQDI